VATRFVFDVGECGVCVYLLLCAEGKDRVRDRDRNRVCARAFVKIIM
jgi:hypothetical protein